MYRALSIGLLSLALLPAARTQAREHEGGDERRERRGQSQGERQSSHQSGQSAPSSGSQSPSSGSSHQRGQHRQRSQGSSGQSQSSHQRRQPSTPSQGGSSSPQQGHQPSTHQGSSGQTGDHRGSTHARTPEPSVPRHFQDIGVRHVPRALNDHQLLRSDPQHSNIHVPTRGGDGRVLHAEAFDRGRMNGAIVHNELRSIARDRAMIADVRRYNESERIAGRYYWHTWNNTSYCHYYDAWGFHWYGWYLGSNYFWVRNYNGGWWWHDPVRLRWCYWYDGFWWWQDPARVSVVYVYNGSDYEPSTAQAPIPAAPTEATPTPTQVAPDVTPLAAPPGEVPSLPPDEQDAPDANPTPSKTHYNL